MRTSYRLGRELVEPFRDTRPGSALHRHVVCCVEHTEGSMVALAEALVVHEHSGGRLSVVHVVDVAEASSLAAGETYAAAPNDEDISIGWLDGLVEGIPGAEAVLLRGAGAARSVVGWARDAGADLIIVGGMRGRVDRALRGDFARYVAVHAHCSVLVARAPD
jgi:nucleotide-binding universal stress UspA family protein